MKKYIYIALASLMLIGCAKTEPKTEKDLIPYGYLNIDNDTQLTVDVEVNSEIKSSTEELKKVLTDISLNQKDYIVTSIYEDSVIWDQSVFNYDNVGNSFRAKGYHTFYWVDNQLYQLRKPYHGGDFLIDDYELLIYPEDNDISPEFENGSMNTNDNVELVKYISWLIDDSEGGKFYENENRIYYKANVMNEDEGVEQILVSYNKNKKDFYIVIDNYGDSHFKHTFKIGGQKVQLPGIKPIKY